MNLPSVIDVVDVGPRDGLQTEATFVPTDLKVAFVEAIADAGVRRIEVTSFVSPKAMPQMRDAEEVMRRVSRRAGVSYSALVPNVRGAERALAVGTDVLRVVCSVTEAANRRNIGRSIDESMTELTAIVELAAQAGRAVELILGMSFGCPLTGAVAPQRVVELAGRGFEAGVREVLVADSYGFADPEGVRRLVSALRARWPDRRIGIHLHDTRGLAIANALVALQAGVDSLDACVGGLGAGGLGASAVANGNVATEDLVNLCEEMGVRTGIDVSRLVEAAHLIGRFLGRDLPGRVQAVGTRAQLFARLSAAASPLPDVRATGVNPS